MTGRVFFDRMLLREEYYAPPPEGNMSEPNEIASH